MMKETKLGERRNIVKLHFCMTWYEAWYMRNSFTCRIEYINIWRAHRALHVPNISAGKRKLYSKLQRNLSVSLEQSRTNSSLLVLDAVKAYKLFIGRRFGDSSFVVEDVAPNRIEPVANRTPIAPQMTEDEFEATCGTIALSAHYSEVEEDIVNLMAGLQLSAEVSRYLTAETWGH
jgi:hypothetical protein